MKKFTFLRSLILLLIMVAFTSVAQTQVCNGNFTLTTQAEVDDFNCTEVTGDLTISGANITDLSPLSSLASVGRDLIIQFNSALANLDDLSSLTSVGGLLYIDDNSSLSNLDGLSSLSSVEQLYIQNNSTLTNLDGLSSLTSVDGYLYIINNSVLTEFCGLYSLLSGGGLGGDYGVNGNAENPSQQNIIDGGACPGVCEGDVTLSTQAEVDDFNCTEVTGSLYIWYSDNITNLDGLSSLTSVGNDLVILWSRGLTNLDGLSNLESVGWNLEIKKNLVLTTLDGLSSLESVGGAIKIEHNPVLTNLSLSSLESFSILTINYNPVLTNVGLSSLVSSGRIYIGGTSTLTNLDGLSSLTSAEVISFGNNSALTNLDGLSSLVSAMAIGFDNNSALTNLDGLSSLTSVGRGGISIHDNSSLTNLDGLSSLASVGTGSHGLKIYNNTVLTEFCGLNPLLSTGGLDGLYRVYDNAENPSQQAIIDGGPCNSPPVAECENVTVSADVSCQATVSASEVDNGSSDPDGDEMTMTLSPEGPYALGETTVTLTVTDPSGESDECTATITVEDDTPPTLTAVSTPITLWSPNHKYETISMSQLFESVSDNCNYELTIDDVYITSVSSDEPENGSGDGNTVNDIVIGGDDCSSVQFRRERDENGNGRVYTVNLAVDDGNDNTGTASVLVYVPISKNGTSVDDGVDYSESCTPTKSSFFANTASDENQLINYPNPFNGSTTITFTLTETENTTLKVYDTYGKLVVTLFDGMAESGQKYTLEFSAGNLPKGIYVYHLQSGNNVSVVKKMILMK